MKPSKVRGRAYTFTINNWEAEWPDTLTQSMNEGDKYVFQAEIGENGTPHLQGVVRYKNARSWNSVKDEYEKYNKAHIEPCRLWKESVEYCTKDESRDPKYPEPWTNIKGLKIERPCLMIRKNWPLRPWQQKVWDIVKEPKDEEDRRIIWVVDEAGGAGKTQFNRYLRQKFKKKWLTVGGIANNIRCGIALWMEKHECEPHGIAVDIPRVQADRVSYAALEELCNGGFYSGKYESGEVYMEYPPWVVVFANSMPRKETMSQDRWEIIMV